MNPAFTRNPDGSLSATVTLTMSPEQWEDWFRHHNARALSCQVGLDEPQVADWAMFQVFAQINGQTQQGDNSELKHCGGQGSLPESVETTTQKRKTRNGSEDQEKQA